MGFLSSIVLLLAGLIGAAPMVTKHMPGLHPTIESIRRYTNIIGLYLLIVGIIKLLRIIFGVRLDPIELIIPLVMIGIGFVQGFEFIMEAFRSNESMTERTTNLRDKLMRYQETLGIIAIVLAVLDILRII